MHEIVFILTSIAMNRRLGFAVILTVISALLLVGAAALLSRDYAQRRAARIELEKTEVAGVVLERAAGLIRPEHFAAPNSVEAQAAFRALYSAVQSPRIFRMKVWAKDGTVLWSNLAEIIGQQFPDNEEVREAFGGEIVLTIEEKKSEHVSEREFAAAAEIYVPLRNVDGSVYGLVEVYEPVLVLDRDIRAAFLPATAPFAVGAVFALMGTAWAWRRARRTGPLPTR